MKKYLLILISALLVLSFFKQTNAQPYCNQAQGTAGFPSDLACQAAVCGYDPFCCNTSWDAICASEAAADAACVGCLTPPSNDLCANAIVVGCGTSVNGYTINGTTTGAPASCVYTMNTSPGVWYSFIGTGASIEINTCGSGTDFDTKIGVFTGSCGALVCETGNDDEGSCGFGGGLSSSVTFCSAAGTQYYIYVTGFSTNVGHFQLAINCTVPVIFSCPSDIFVDNDSGVCGATVSVPVPVAGVDYDNAISFTNDYNGTDDASDYYPVGNTLVTWAAADNCSSVFCVQNITVTDTTLPEFTNCPGNIAAYCDSGSGGAVITYDVPSEMAPLIVDQAQLIVGVNMADFTQSDLAQSFIPSVSPISGANLYLFSGGSGVGDVTIGLWDNLPNNGGVLLASGTEVNVAPGDVVNVSWTPTPVSVGTTYYLVFTSTGTGLQIAGDLANSYAFGNLFANSGYTPFLTYDFTFETFTSLPTNVTDNCGILSVNQTDSSGLTSGSVFPVGTTTIEYTAIDLSGNSSICTFDITITDTTAPVLNCLSDTLLSNDAGLCGAVYNYTAPVGIDACPDVFLPHSTTQTMMVGGGLGCADIYSYLNRYATIFDLPALGYPDAFHLTAVEFAVGTAVSDTGVQQVIVNIYSLSGPMAIANLTLLASEEVLIPDQSMSMVNVPIDTLIPAGTKLVYELYVPDGQTTQNYFRIETNFDGQSTPSYIMAPHCGAPDYTDLMTLGLTNAYIMNIIGGTSTHLISGLGAGAEFPVGTTTEVYASTDLSGNSDTCSFDVTVEDNEAPALCGLPATIFITYAQDSLTQPPFSVLSGGVLTGRPFASGTCCSANNPMTDLFVFTVDTTGTYGIHQIQTGWDGYILLYTDPLDFGVSPPITFVAGDDDGTGGIGTSDIDSVNLIAGQWYYLYSTGFGTADNGAFSTSFTGPGNITTWINTCQHDTTLIADPANCGAFFTYAFPVATDNCSGVTTALTGGIGSGGTFPLGVTTEEYTAVDAYGNSTVFHFAVTVLDTTSPTIICPPDLIVYTDPGVCYASGVFLGNPVVNDTCGGIADVSNNGLEPFTVGTHFILWTATDSSGNTASCTQQLTVLDTTGPILSCQADTTVDYDSTICGAVVTYIPPIGTDNCSFDFLTQSTANDTITPGTSVACTAGGLHVDNSYFRVYDLSAMGLTADLDITGVRFGIENAQSPSGSQPVTVNLYTMHDTLLMANLTLVASQAAIVPNQSGTFMTVPISALISPDSILVVELFTPDGTADTNAFLIGANSLGESADGYLMATPCGITEPFTLTAIGFPGMNIILDLEIEGTITSVQIAGLGSGATFPLGTTTETYSATDLYGNTSYCSFNITVNDTNAPLIMCAADTTVSADSGLCTAAIVLDSPFAFDHCGIDTVTNDAPSLFPVGVTVVTWTATDNSGLTSMCYQTVTVNDDEVPTIVCPAAVSVSTDAGLCTASAVVLGSPLTGDNCGVDSITNDAPAIFPLGTTLVTWVVVDVNGNSDSCTQSVTVTDDEDPTISCPVDVTVPNDSAGNYATNVALGNPTTGDNCGVDTVYNDGSEPYVAGNTTVTWTVVDVNGNTASCAQTVTVNSTFGIADVDADGDALRNDPNPFHATTLISFYLHHNASCSLTVTDMLGRTVKVIFEGKNLDAGKYTEELDAHANNMVPGVYYLQLTIDHKSLVSKMVVN